MDKTYLYITAVILLFGLYLYISLDHSNTITENLSSDSDISPSGSNNSTSENLNSSNPGNTSDSISTFNTSNSTDTNQENLSSNENPSSQGSTMNTSTNSPPNQNLSSPNSHAELSNLETCPWHNSTYWRTHPLRGAVIEMGYGSPYEVGPPYPGLNSLKLLKSYGANIVNLEVQYTWTMHPPYRRDPNAFKLLHEALSNLREAGLYAIVSIRNGPGRNDMFSGLDYEDELLLDIYHDPSAQRAWLDMLNDTISEFKNDSTIIAWDPMVEPAPYEYTSRNGLPDDYGYSWWNNFSKECVQLIRSIDPLRPIIIEGSDWANPHSFAYLEPVDDPNVIYSVHNYWPMEYSHQAEPPFNYSYPGKICYWDELNDREFCGYVDKHKLDLIWKPVDDFQNKYNATIFVGEWGGMRFVPGMANYLRDQLSTIESRGWSHTYYAWGYDPGWDVQAFQLACGSNITNLKPDPEADTFRYIYNSWQENEPLNCG